MSHTDHKIFVGQKLRLEFTIRDENHKIVDLSVGGTVVNVVLKRAGGSKKTFTGTLVTDGTDGKVTYTTAAADLDAAGVWKGQCIYIDAALDEVPSTIIDFEVSARI